MMRKKELRLRITKSAVFLLLFLLTIGSCLAILADVTRLLPTGSEYSLSDQALIQGEGIPFTALAAARTQNHTLIVSAQTSVSAKVSAAVSTYEYDEVTLSLTDDQYPRFHQLDFVKGAMFSTAVSGRNTDAAVISEKLATQVFASVDVIGSTFKVNGVKLTVVGVYREEPGILSQISTDGRCEVLVPYYTSVPGVPNTIQHLYLKNAPAEDKVSPAAKEKAAENADGADAKERDQDTAQVSAVSFREFDAQLGGKLARYEANDYSVQKRTVQQYRQILLFVAGLIAILFLLCWCVGSLSRTGRWAVRVHRSVEPLRPSPLIKKLILPVVLILVMIGVFLLIRFELFMPVQSIPEGDEILNFAAYYRAWIQSFQVYHLSVAQKYFQNLVLYGSNAASVLILLSAVWEILLFYQALRILRLFIKAREEKDEDAA